jgi:hypothetical protein
MTVYLNIQLTSDYPCKWNGDPGLTVCKTYLRLQLNSYCYCCYLYIIVCICVCKYMCDGWRGTNVSRGVCQLNFVVGRFHLNCTVASMSLVCSWWRILSFSSANSTSFPFNYKDRFNATFKELTKVYSCCKRIASPLSSLSRSFRSH